MIVLVGLSREKTYSPPGTAGVTSKSYEIGQFVILGVKAENTSGGELVPIT